MLERVRAFYRGHLLCSRDEARAASVQWSRLRPSLGFMHLYAPRNILCYMMLNPQSTDSVLTEPQNRLPWRCPSFRGILVPLMFDNDKTVEATANRATQLFVRRSSIGARLSAPGRLFVSELRKYTLSCSTCRSFLIDLL